ncbi:MAG: hypothetical protein HRU15_04980, partial [Planctomycetes bacterium]|nr:hypothetical protein [Planctomycetota bacterium]
MSRERGYFWLQPAAPAAIAVFRMHISNDSQCFSQPMPKNGHGVFALLIDAAAEEIDEVVILRIDDEYCDVHCHGGVGIRARVNTAMETHDYHCIDPEYDARWEDFSQIAHPAALPYLQQWDDIQPRLKAYCKRQPVILLTGPANAGKSTL